MSEYVDIMEITVCLSSDGFTGHIDEYPKSKEAKVWITLSNRSIYNRIYKKTLLKPRIIGLDSHDKIRKTICCYKKDKKKAFKILKDALFLEFHKREKYYQDMKKSLLVSDSYKEYIDWFIKKVKKNG